MLQPPPKDRVTRSGNFPRTMLQQQHNGSKISALVERGRDLRHLATYSWPGSELDVLTKPSDAPKYLRRQMQQCVWYACLPRIGSLVCIDKRQSSSSCFSDRPRLLSD